MHEVDKVDNVPGISSFMGYRWRRFSLSIIEIAITHMNTYSKKELPLALQRNGTYWSNKYSICSFAFNSLKKLQKWRKKWKVFGIGTSHNLRNSRKTAANVNIATWRRNQKH